MEPKEYILAAVDGEYAILKNIEDDTEIFIAMALLPPGADTGTKLRFENFEYTIIME